MWTLKDELEKRGMTVPEACLKCGMDYKTMTILVNGGVTLPSLALKVGRGLGLTQEQVKTLGKPLMGKCWPKNSRDAKAKSNGLAITKAIERDMNWWRQLHEQA